MVSNMRTRQFTLTPHSFIFRGLAATYASSDVLSDVVKMLTEAGASRLLPSNLALLRS